MDTKHAGRHYFSHPERDFLKYSTRTYLLLRAIATANGECQLYPETFWVVGNICDLVSLTVETECVKGCIKIDATLRQAITAAREVVSSVQWVSQALLLIDSRRSYRKTCYVFVGLCMKVKLKWLPKYSDENLLRSRGSFVCDKNILNLERLCRLRNAWVISETLFLRDPVGRGSNYFIFWMLGFTLLKISH